MNFYPEGKNDALLCRIETAEELRKAIREERIMEATALLCDREHNLHVDLGGYRGIIPREEGALGISDGSVRDIALISRVNKRVQFVATSAQTDSLGNTVAALSRRRVQELCSEEFVGRLNLGDIIDARVTRLERFGAFIDISAGLNALIPIDMLSVSRISHPCERLFEGQDIRVALRRREDGRLTFTLKELLGTWQENADLFTVGETVTGIVRSVEEYGVFVELMPNLAGLAAPQGGLFAGQQVSVYIKSVIPEKMKIKLIIVEAFGRAAKPSELKYFVTDGRLDRWDYSPEGSVKCIRTEFN